MLVHPVSIPATIASVRRFVASAAIAAVIAAVEAGYGYQVEPVPIVASVHRRSTPQRRQRLRRRYARRRYL